MELMDACLEESYVESQAVRCIQVGLLCLQKFPEDGPTMSSVVFMLGTEGADLPQPKEPGFFIERRSVELDVAPVQGTCLLENAMTTALSELDVAPVQICQTLPYDEKNYNSYS